MNFQYPQTLILNYSTDLEYRQCLRDLSLMKSEINYQDVNDEYDETAIQPLIDYITELTKDDLLRKVIEDVSQRMWSKSINIGIMILLSFNYLYHFHQCIIAHLHGKKYDYYIQAIHQLIDSDLTKR